MGFSGNGGEIPKTVTRHCLPIYVRGEKMKKLLLIAVALLLSGCAVMSHQAPDGSVTTYMSLGRTDTVKAGDIVLVGKSDIDPSSLIGGMVK
jgi:uncharacterized lipoprotein YajG